MVNLFNFPEPQQPQTLDEKIAAAVSFLKRAEKLALRLHKSLSDSSKRWTICWRGGFRQNP